MDFDLPLVDGGALDFVLIGRRVLDGALDEHDGLAAEALGPPDHVLGDNVGLYGQNALDGEQLLTEDNEGDLRACTYALVPCPPCG